MTTCIINDCEKNTYKNNNFCDKHTKKIIKANIPHYYEYCKYCNKFRDIVEVDDYSICCANCGMELDQNFVNDE